MEIGESIRRWRVRRALTQIELAQMASISQNSLSRIETGQHKPRPTTLRKIAVALNVDVDALQGFTRDAAKSRQGED